MFVIERTTENVIRAVRPYLNSSYNYYTNGVDDKRIWDDINYTIDLTVPEITIDGTTYPLNVLGKNSITISKNSAERGEGFVINSQVSDTLVFKPQTQPELEISEVSVSVGDNSFSIDTADTFVIHSKNKISEILFLKIKPSTLTARGNYVTVS